MSLCNFLAISVVVVLANAAQWSIQTDATVPDFLWGNDAFSKDCASVSGLGYVDLYENGQYSKLPVQYPDNYLASIYDLVYNCDTQTIIAASACSGCFYSMEHFSFPFFFVFVSHDSGKSFTAVNDYAIDSFAVSRINGIDGGFAIVGQLYLKGTNIKTGNGLLFSLDNGKTFKPIVIPGDEDAFYGSFPSPKTWFVTKSTVNFIQENPSLKVSSSEYTGSVWKTEDGGESWSNVFNLPTFASYRIMRGISCASTTTCVATAYGMDYPTYKIRAYVTNDGGSSWKESFSEDATNDCFVDVYMPKMLNDKDGWLATTYKDAVGYPTGNFHRTIDGGNSWTLEQQLENCNVRDISFTADGNFGVATCGMKGNLNATLAFYQ